MSRRDAYNSLRDRHDSSVGTAPISFVKSGPDEYRSRDDLWRITHRYVRGYQAHHEWHVYAPDGSLFDRFTHGSYYATLSDAVQAINEAVVCGPIFFLRNLYRRQDDWVAEQAQRDKAARVRAEREYAVYNILGEHRVENSCYFAGLIVDALFGKEQP